MTITHPMVLPPDILVIPSEDLDEETRSKCKCPDGHFVLTRPNSRIPSSVVNKAVVNLLNQFREPKTIVEASMEIYLATGGTPEKVLEKVFFALQPFIKGRWLVPSGARDAGAIEPSLPAGSAFSHYMVSHCVQVLEDTEVYQLKGVDGQFAALKIAREGAAEVMLTLLQHEEEILRTLGGASAPRLLDSGVVAGRNFIVMDWCSGVWVTNAVAEIRRLFTSGARSELLKLCCEITRAYSTLHERGILHGDIHPKNILVDQNGAVSLIDFGLSRKVGDNGIKGRPRGGVTQFYAPELADQILRGQPWTQSSPAGEQYAIAALLYLVVCGKPYLEFAAYKDEALCQIVNQEPIPFSERGVIWPELESILAKALSKNPCSRFCSVVALSSALAELNDAESFPLRLAAALPFSPPRDPLPINLTDLNQELQLPAHVPSCSVSFGAAGIAYALYCVASMRCNAGLLALADAWSLRAERTVDELGAFTSEKLKVDVNSIGSASVWFGRPGVYLVKALVSQALGDQASVWRAIESYKAACSAETKGHDLTLGTAGKLLGCALLLDAIGAANTSGQGNSPAHEILTLGESFQRELWAHLGQATGNDDSYLGIAHGVSGMFYATLIWSETSGQPLPETIETKLEELSGYAQNIRRGVQFPVRRDQRTSFMESWCHGTPGYVHLWAAAYRAFRKPFYLQMVERCAWTTWDSEGSTGTLCCGDAGRAYALLSAWRHTDDRAWLLKAEDLAVQAIKYSTSDQDLIHALYKGALGAVILVNDLEAAAQASMPLFERDIRGGN